MTIDQGTQLLNHLHALLNGIETFEQISFDNDDDISEIGPGKEMREELAKAVKIVMQAVMENQRG